MARISESFGCTALRARAAFSAGCVHYAEGDLARALAELRRSWRLWAGLDSPYEAGRARLMIGRVLQGLGDEESATAEFTAARATFA